MILRLIDDVIQAGHTVVQTYLTAKVTEVNNRWGLTGANRAPGIPSTDIVVDDQVTWSNLPSAWVGLGNGTVPNDAETSVGNLIHNIELGVIVSAPTSPLASRWIRAYSQAMNEVLAEHRTFDGACMWAVVTADRFATPAQSPDEAGLIRTAFCDVAVVADEPRRSINMFDLEG